MISETRQILIVEDEQAILSLLTDILSYRGGYPVKTAMTGPEAIEIYKNNFSEIALVILDLNMPGMGGMEVFQELKTINPDVKVLISTGYGKSDKINALIKDGVKGYVQKPYNILELLRTVKDLIISDNDNR